MTITQVLQQKTKSSKRHW